MSSRSIGAIMLLAFAAVVVLVIIRVRKVNRQLREEEALRRRADGPIDPVAATSLATCDPKSLAPGYMVTWGDSSVTYTVRGTVTLTEGGSIWREYFVDPIRGAKRYLSVGDEDGDLEVIAWTSISDTDLRPRQHQIAHNNVVYTRVERGEACYRSRGTTDLPPSGCVVYHDYSDGGDRRLSFERFDGGKWELSTGRVVPIRLMTIYPPTR